MQGGFGRKGQAPGQAGAPQQQQQSPRRERLEFDVTWGKIHMLLVFVFFAACTAVLVFAMQHYDAVSLYHLVELEGLGKNLFFGGLALVSAAMSLIGAMNLLRSFGEKRLVVLTHDTVTGPAGHLSKRQVSIPFALIADIQLRASGKHRFCVITGHDGRKIKLGEPNFRVPGGFDKFLGALDERLGS